MKRTEMLKVMKERIKWGWDFDKIYDYLCELDKDGRRRKKSGETLYI